LYIPAVAPYHPTGRQVPAIEQMQMSGKKKSHPDPPAVRKNLTDLKRGEPGILDHIDLPEDESRRLMEMGFVPGHTIVPAQSAPGGDPRVFRVDGSEIALRRETAVRLILRPDKSAKG
jgi:ferrous iron transport protein A